MRQMTAVRLSSICWAQKHILALIVSRVQINSLQINIPLLIYYICVSTHYQIIMTFCVWLSFNGGCGMCVCRGSWFTLERRLNLILVKICKSHQLLFKFKPQNMNPERSQSVLEHISTRSRLQDELKTSRKLKTSTPFTNSLSLSLFCNHSMTSFYQTLHSKHFHTLLRSLHLSSFSSACLSLSLFT